MKDEELKPCPICGETQYVGYYYEDDNEVSVLCHQCTFETHVHRSEKSAARDWNALPRHLHWTKEKPKKDGWYWFRHKAFNTYIAKVTCGGTILFGQYFNVKDINDDAEWAGPIPEPKEKV